MILLIPAATALLGGLLAPRIPSRKARNRFLLAASLLSSVLLILLALRQEAVPEWTPLRVTPLFTVSFRLDRLNRVFLLLIAFLWPIAVLYSLEYMEHAEREPRFLLFYLLSFAVTQLLARIS